MGLIASYNLRSMTVRKGTAAMTAMGIAMVVAVFVMTLAIAQGFHGDAGRQRLDRRTRSCCARARRRRTSARCCRPQLPLIQTLPQVARGADGHPLASPELVVIIALPRMSDNQPANVPVRGVGPLAFDVRDTLTLRRRTPLHARHARDQRRPAGDRPLQGADARQRREVRRRDLEGRRRLHRRRCVVRVGSVGRRRSDDAGVPARRLSVGDGEADRSVGVRVVRRRRSPPTRASISRPYRERDYYEEQSATTDDGDPRVRHVRHR